MRTIERLLLSSITSCSFVCAVVTAEALPATTQSAMCILKNANLPALPPRTKVLRAEADEGGAVGSYVLSFEGAYGEPPEWWAKAPEWVGGENADWEDCSAKGVDDMDASCVEGPNGHVMVEEKKRTITLTVDVPLGAEEGAGAMRCRRK